MAVFYKIFSCAMARENFFYAQIFQLGKRAGNSPLRRARQVQAANHGMNRQRKSLMAILS